MVGRGHSVKYHIFAPNKWAEAQAEVKKGGAYHILQQIGGRAGYTIVYILKNDRAFFLCLNSLHQREIK